MEIEIPLLLTPLTKVEPSQLRPMDELRQVGLKVEPS